MYCTLLAICHHHSVVHAFPYIFSKTVHQYVHTDCAEDSEFLMMQLILLVPFSMEKAHSIFFALIKSAFSSYISKLYFVWIVPLVFI